MAPKGDPQATVFTVSFYTLLHTGTHSNNMASHTHTGTVYLISVAEGCQYRIISSRRYVKQPVTMS